MKKMNKMYEAPKAEMIEMHPACVLMASLEGGQGDPFGGDDPNDPNGGLG